jgi:uncharacterized membrane protein YhiD involved in acid resistance
MSPQAELFYRFGIALLIGFLVGLQREFDYDSSEKPDDKQFAGVRTFSLIGLTGCSAALRRAILPGFLLTLTAAIVLAFIL